MEVKISWRCVLSGQSAEGWVLLRAEDVLFPSLLSSYYSFAVNTQPCSTERAAPLSTGSTDPDRETTVFSQLPELAGACHSDYCHTAIEAKDAVLQLGKQMLLLGKE